MIGGLLSGLWHLAVWVWWSAPVPVTVLALAWLVGTVAVFAVPRDNGHGTFWRIAGRAGLVPAGWLADPDECVPGPAEATSGDELAEVVWLDDRRAG